MPLKVIQITAQIRLGTLLPYQLEQGALVSQVTVKPLRALV